MAMSAVLCLSGLSGADAGEFKVTEVYSGDTVKVEGHDIEVRVRMVGVDAPEVSRGWGKPGQAFSQEARDHLAGLIRNKTVDVQGHGLDDLGRVLGVIHLKERNINLEMIRAGLAEVLRGLAPHKFDLIPYWLAEKQARDAGIGVWSLGDEYISPARFRAEHTRKGHEGESR